MSSRFPTDKCAFNVWRVCVQLIACALQRMAFAHQCQSISAEPSLLILSEPSMSNSQCGTIIVEPSMPDIAVTLTCIDSRTNRWLSKFKCVRLSIRNAHTQ